MSKPHVIMIVEDEAFTALNLQVQLEQAGFDICDILSTGEQAIATAQRKHPDLILMDIRLAGELNGIEAAEVINNQQSAQFIFMSGYDDQDLIKRAFALNTVKYLVKPVAIPELLKVINSMTGQS